VTPFKPLLHQLLEFNGVEVGKASAHARYKKFSAQGGQFERLAQMLLCGHAPQNLDVNIVIGPGFRIH
jgi:hypothetical protein